MFSERQMADCSTLWARRVQDFAGVLISVYTLDRWLYSVDADRNSGLPGTAGREAALHNDGDEEQ